MDAYGTPLYRFCRRLVGEEALAEDAHQLTFVQAYEGLARFDRRSSLRSWLYSIARHRCLDALKITRRRRARIEAVPELPERPVAEASAEERLVERVRRRMLESCLGKLAPKVRSALLLRFQEELSYPEMAQVSGERPATLQARVARALPALRHCLETQEEAA
jgi:RNA polymerase sigma-70 factor (ECF subfamily)